MEEEEKREKHEEEGEEEREETEEEEKEEQEEEAMVSNLGSSFLLTLRAIILKTAVSNPVPSQLFGATLSSVLSVLLASPATFDHRTDLLTLLNRFQILFDRNKHLLSGTDSRVAFYFVKGFADLYFEKEQGSRKQLKKKKPVYPVVFRVARTGVTRTR